MSLCVDFRHVLVKGGDLPDSLDAIDVLFDGMHLLKTVHDRIFILQSHDLLKSTHAFLCLWCDLAGRDFFEFQCKRIKTPNTHGTGCSLASSIAAELAKGSSVVSAIKVIW